MFSYCACVILSNMKDFVRGIKACIPVSIGVVPVGIAFAVVARQGGLSTWQVVLMSAIVFAGSAQFMAVGMLTGGAAMPAIIFATFLLNLRHLIMSSYVMDQLKDTRLMKKLLLAFPLCDETFALFALRDATENDENYLLGLNALLYVMWLLATIAGCFAAEFLPKIVADSLGIAFYAAFLALLIPKVKGSLRLILVVLCAMAINWLLSLFVSAGISVIISTLAGAGIGMFLLPDESAPEGGEMRQ